MNHSFLHWFLTEIYPRLAHRAEGFRIIARFLESLPFASAPIIVETGTTRIAENWQGDGCATVIFDRYTRDVPATFLSVDIDPEAIKVAKKLVENRTLFVQGDSVEVLAHLGELVPALKSRDENPRYLDLLYLDSYNVDWANPHPSALHHLKELQAVLPFINEKTMLAIDDAVNLDGRRGKSLYIDQLFHELGIKPVHSGYQVIYTGLDPEALREPLRSRCRGS